MRSFNGQLAEYTAREVARYKKGQFQIVCKVFDNQYFMTFHNGRQTSVTRYTDDKDEANNWIKEQISKGFQRV